MRRSHVSIGVLICCMFIAVIVALFMVEPPARATEPLLILVGSLAAAFGAVVNYWFGSSSGSARKDELIAAGRSGDVTITQGDGQPPPKP